MTGALLKEQNAPVKKAVERQEIEIACRVASFSNFAG
jgi:hypothetical protein